MHCDGKCHLKKELDKEEKKEQSPVNPVKEKNEVQLFSEKRNEINFLSVAVPENVNSVYQFSGSDQHLFSVFHPPKI